MSGAAQSMGSVNQRGNLQGMMPHSENHFDVWLLPSTL
jgi:phosphoribosylformylglycinamidine (FGAM) synthase-like amidotransferase family enzyme